MLSALNGTNVGHSRGAATGLGRESLYKAFSGKTKARFDTVMKVISALGLSLTIPDGAPGKGGRSAA